MTAVRWVVRLLGWAFAALVVAAVAIVVVVPRAVHGEAMSVLTGSMSPAVPVGSLVVVRPVDPDTLEVGDVATYQREEGRAVYVTHRITRVDTSTTPTTYTFRGDANRVADADPVPATAVRGEVWFHVPWLGAVRDALHGAGGIVVIGVVALGGYAVTQLAGAARDRRRRDPARWEPTPVTTLASVDAVLLLVTLDVTRLGVHAGLTPAQAAAELGATVLDHDGWRCRLLLAVRPDDVDAARDRVDALGPLSVETLDQDRPLAGVPAQRRREAATV